MDKIRIYRCLVSFPIAAKLEIHTVGFNGEITIKAIMMGKYLAMDNAGGAILKVIKGSWKPPLPKREASRKI